MKQAILEIIDRKMEQRTPYKEKMPLHKTLWYEVCHGWYIVLQELREEISKMDEWIELEEKYPEDNTMVLACYDVHIDVAQWYASEHSWRWIWDSHIPYTHWMPLPPNPSFHE